MLGFWVLWSGFRVGGFRLNLLAQKSVAMEDEAN